MKHKKYHENGKLISLRMCVSCRQHKPKSSLIRIVKSPDGIVFVDNRGNAQGRGAYVCKKAECIEKCGQTGLIQRSLKTKVSKEIYEVLFDIEQ